MKENIFIVNGPFVFYSVKYILENFNSFKEEKNIVLIFSKKKYSINIKNKNYQYFFFETGSIFKYIRALLYFKFLLKKIMSNKTQKHLYIANASHFSSNYLLFNDFFYSYNLLPEGIANYYLAKPNKKTMYLKKILGNITKLPYYQYDTHLSGCEEKEFDCVFTFSEQNLYTKAKKTILIKPNKLPNNLNKAYEHVLILDQELESILPKNDILEINTILESFIIENKLTYLYKAHPNQKKTTRSDFIKKISLAKTINDNKPIELLIEDLTPRVVISFLSSALVNIKILYPEIECIALGEKIYERNKKYQFILNLYKLHNIKLY